MTSKSNLVINPQRLWDSLMETAKFGGTGVLPVPLPAGKGAVAGPKTVARSAHV